VAGPTLLAPVSVEATVGSVATGDAGGDATGTQNTAIHYRYSERRFNPYPANVENRVSS
jgi:hypothetical protein